MDNTQLMVAMIERCKAIIIEHGGQPATQPKPLQRSHLVWMCDRLINKVDAWSAPKLNRWIGFIQCAMIANRYIDLDEAKAMFDDAKNAFGEPSQDLLDHLDPDSPFEFDIGGQG